MPSDAQRVWAGSMAEVYERWLVPTTFRPFAVDLAGRVAMLVPQRVLELAAGTGVVTRQLVEMTSAAVVATDLNQAMIDLGARRVPDATWQQADAMSLPFVDGEFDLVACQFGVMFFPDKPTAFAEARRVLRGDGSFLFSAWDRLETHGFEAPLVAALEHALPEDPPRFLANVPHSYFEPEVIHSDLAAAGFADVTIELVTVEGTATRMRDLVTGYCTGTPLRAEIEARGDLADITEAVAEELEDRLGAGPVTASMSALVVQARPARS